MKNNIRSKAIKYATIKHQGQERLNGEDYINHPMRVADNVLKYFATKDNIDDLVAAAYLHDTIEDTDTTYLDLVDNFDINIANLVNELTNNDELKHRLGKTKYLQMKMLLMSDDALNIKLCDRLDNAIDIDNAPLAFAKKYISETLDIYMYLIENRNLSGIQRKIIEDTIMKIRELKVSTGQDYKLKRKAS